MFFVTSYDILLRIAITYRKIKIINTCFVNKKEILFHRNNVHILAFITTKRNERLKLENYRIFSIFSWFTISIVWSPRIVTKTSEWKKIKKDCSYTHAQISWTTDRNFDGFGIILTIIQVHPISSKYFKILTRGSVRHSGI